MYRGSQLKRQQGSVLGYLWRKLLGPCSKSQHFLAASKNLLKRIQNICLPLCVKWVLIHIPQVFWSLLGKEGKPEAWGINQYCSPYIQHSEKHLSVSVPGVCGRDLFWVSILWFHPGIQNYHPAFLKKGKKCVIPELLIKSNCSGMSVTWYLNQFLSWNLIFIKVKKKKLLQSEFYSE